MNFAYFMNVATMKLKQVNCSLHKGAGRGKSHVLKALYQGLYHTLCTETGHSRQNCTILVIAATGKVTYNVKGTPIHVALCIPAKH